MQIVSESRMAHLKISPRSSLTLKGWVGFLVSRELLANVGQSRKWVTTE